ncbi:hypothetical protein EKL98_01075 [Flavobacterium bomense]|uniref:Uncharacterized protein n=1 Tax=Flavobacterium bomense TaxID=2497483 RepID=A0A432CQW9_9FLAO|nr:hypothetical protein [Flavobacterium bomense]RTZ07942.1 hypothetical protein EKL98_01075 [Flavobacterium bomense]
MDNSKIVTLLKRIKDLDTNYSKLLVPLPMSKQITSYMLIREDLLFVKTNAELLLESKKKKPRNEHTEETLWYSLIILYGRCFSDATRGQKVKLDKEDFFNINNETNILLITHNKIIDIRNNFLAHRGDNENEIPIVYVKIPKGEIPEEYTIEFKIVSTRYVTESSSFLEQIIDLVDFLIPKIKIKTDKCGERLKKGIFNLDAELLKKLTIE